MRTSAIDPSIRAILMQRVFSREDVQDRILEMNREQMMRSEYPDGRPMPKYAESTRRHKLRVGLPADRYTYYETGKFHAFGFEVVPHDGMVSIVQSLEAPDYVVFLDLNVLGLSEENWNEIKNMIRPLLLEEYENYMQNG